MEINNEEFKEIQLFCPTYPIGEDMNFVAFGDENDFKIPVFTNHESYKEGYKYLKLDEQEQEYNLYTTKMNFFIQLAANDPGFTGLIVNLPEDKMILDKEKLLSFID
ncbi:MAG: hypothetical protein Q4P18_08100 [Methanobrevibacter sp.]|uniref:hypothetical protein n=1 Tax=Methanobrevibacter sp. TaxID=66852 RepID=UPI0026DEF987|nr:hypothetical protein [Methanobrevibacter sp.]MDO5849483.1 hypothetical protein [Methanobrevibacter sp.]